MGRELFDNGDGSTDHTAVCIELPNRDVGGLGSLIDNRQPIPCHGLVSGIDPPMSAGSRCVQHLRGP